MAKTRIQEKRPCQHYVSTVSTIASAKLAVRPSQIADQTQKQLPGLRSKPVAECVFRLGLRSGRSNFFGNCRSQ